MRPLSFFLRNTLLAAGLAFASFPALAVDPRPPAPTAAPWPEPPVLGRPTPDELQRLEAGEIVVREARADAAGGGALSFAVFHVDIALLWDTIADCAANRRFVRGLRECEVEKRGAGRALTHQRLKPYALMPTLDYRFETVREPYDWIRIRLVGGDLRALEGAWRFEALHGGEAWLVVHEVHVQPLLPVPRWLARRTVRRDAGDLLACLRWETRGWPDPRQRGLDRGRCPG